LVAVLLTLNLLAVVGLASSRLDVRSAMSEQRALETRADARTFEALLAQQHAAVSFLAQAPPLATLETATAAGDDPVRRRWTRLDIEASLLLFLESSPAVSRLEVDWDETETGTGLRAVAVRRGGVPQLAPPDRAAPENPALLSADWPLGDGAGQLRAWIDPAPLLATTGPGLRLHRGSPAAATGSVEPVTSDLWSPPFHGWVERREVDNGVVLSVERLADRYGWTLFFNVSLIPLSLVLAGLTLRRVRRLARLESEAAQQARLQALESQVRHAERLASLGRFAAGIAHEINNPLEGMANYLHLLSDDLERGSPADARRWLPRLHEGIDRAAGTVRQVQRFAEPGRGDKRAMDLVEVVESTVAFLRGHPDCAKVELRTRSTGSVPLVGDPQTLGQLVLNLVLNACQAQPKGGQVEVRSERHEDGAELLVLDRGPGFPPAVLEHLFEPFQSTRGSLGLGLAVSHGIVVDHGGRITVSGRGDGAGTQVRVVLPQQPPKEGPP
jgi:signal transduction histidine kinase